jgi:hypothetical protein
MNLKSKVVENLDARQTAIEYSKALKRDIRIAEENQNPLSVQIETELRKVCKIPTEDSIDNFPELKAIIEGQKEKEKHGLGIWKRELRKVMKENKLSEKEIEEEE